MPSPFVPFDTQYSAHTDVTLHPTTGIVTITVAFHPNNRGGYNCKIWELDPPYTGKPRPVRDHKQGVASVGPFGHGASIALPTGGVLTCVPVAGDGSEVEPSILIDMGLGQPYALGGDALGIANAAEINRLQGIVRDHEQRLDALEAANNGGLDERDRELLEYLRGIPR